MKIYIVSDATSSLRIKRSSAVIIEDKDEAKNA